MLLNLKSGRIRNHPIHPVLVHVPIGFWTGVLIFDIAHLVTGSPTVAVASFYCLLGALITSIPAAIFGLVELGFTPPATQVRRLAITHGVLNAVVVVLTLVNYVVRRSSFEGVPDGVPALAFVLTLLGYGILGVSGYLGGKMVYEHGMGLHPEERDNGGRQRLYPPAPRERDRDAA